MNSVKIGIIVGIIIVVFSTIIILNLYQVEINQEKSEIKRTSQQAKEDNHFELMRAGWINSGPFYIDMEQYLIGDKNALQMYVEKGKIEIEALTYIRGRSIGNSFIIIDEAQNLSTHELKTIITRAGEGTKVVLTDCFFKDSFIKNFKILLVLFFFDKVCNIF